MPRGGLRGVRAEPLEDETAIACVPDHLALVDIGREPDQRVQTGGESGHFNAPDGGEREQQLIASALVSQSHPTQMAVVAAGPDVLGSVS